MHRRLLVCSVLTAVFLALAAPAFACGGLLSPNGSVNLVRTTTLAAYHNGVEHYVTSFRFVGGGGAKFGSIVPLPGIPSKVERGGDWTLQRLEREVNPPPKAIFAEALRASATVGDAQVLLQTRIDALDITVLKGGGGEVARWAEHHGFELPPDAPEVLDFYANRSPIFMAASFNSKAAQARGLGEGDGTPIHLTIPTPAPWVPLRILGLGKKPAELIEADVFLLTDRAPSMLPAPVGFRSPDVRPLVGGLQLKRSENASDQLMRDLSVDKGMSWMPKHMWLSYLTVQSAAAELRYDLALDTSGAGQPSYVAAGLTTALQHIGTFAGPRSLAWPVALAIGLVAAAIGAVGAVGVRRFAAP